MPDNKTQGFEFVSRYDRFELKALRQVTERHTPYIKVEEIPQEGLVQPTLYFFLSN